MARQPPRDDDKDDDDKDDVHDDPSPSRGGDGDARETADGGAARARKRGPEAAKRSQSTRTAKDDDEDDDDEDDGDQDDEDDDQDDSDGDGDGDDDGTDDAPPERDEPIDKRLTRWARVAAPVGVLLLATVGGLTLGASAVVLVLACGALVAVIAVFWASLRTLVGETPLEGADAYALGAPRTEEEQKRAVLRALKDLEFERSVGKISEEDYAALVGRYRAEAKRLLRLLDEEAAPRRRRVEGLVAERLKAVGLATAAAVEPPPKAPKAATPAPSAPNPAPAPAKKVSKKARRKAAAAAASAATTAARPRVCATCDTENDADAVFCKKCGARCAPASSEETASQAEES